MTVFLLAGAQSPFLWLVWFQVLLFLSKGVREITRVFRDTLRNRLISDHINLKTPSLFVCSCAPAFIGASLISIIVLVFILPPGSNFFYSLVLCMAAHMTLTLCAGTDELTMFSLNKKMSYEITVTMVAFGLFGISLSGIPYLELVFMIFWSAGLWGIMRYN